MVVQYNALHKVLMSQAQQWLAALKADPEFPSTPAHFELIKMAQLEAEFPNTETPHMLITLALPNDYDYTVLQNKLEDSTFPYLDAALARVESFSDGGKKNLHVHILKKGKHPKSKIIRDLSRRFKIAPNFVDVRSSKSTVRYNNSHNYVHGLKDETKQADVQLDVQWRLENGFKEIYNLTV